MSYLTVTQATAEWLLGKTGLLDALHRTLVADTAALASWKGHVMVEGPVRLAISRDGQLVALWNVDYLSGTGEEAWGFLRWDGDLGLLREPGISREVLERCLYVVNQRLQGLFIDGAFIHRSYENGAHTCLAGRGTQARHFSVGYFERNIDTQVSASRSIVCVGPAYDWQRLSRGAATAAETLDALVAQTNALLSGERQTLLEDTSVFIDLRRSLAPYETDKANEYREVEIATGARPIARADAYRVTGLTYDDWIAAGSPLTEVQRRILLSDPIERHPIRIVGPGGSGKTLVMQLLAMRRLKVAADRGNPLRVLYVVHNAAMAKTVKQRFAVLQGDGAAAEATRVLDVCTLAEYGRTQLSLEHTALIDPDAHEAKQFQLEQVTAALLETMKAMPAAVNSSNLFGAVQLNPELLPVLVRLVMSEISTAIKGHGLEGDKRRYIQSDRRLSRLHGILSPEERELVFHVYERYHAVVFEEHEVLDSDDIALSLLGRLRTPIWELKRKALGYDYVFVDETQLFNENERRLFALLTNNKATYVPIVLALDEAQDVYAQSTAGLATLGIPNITNENLSSIHRSTRAIVKLAFFVIQRCVDLFGPDFPDFTGIAERMEPDSHPLAAPPQLEVVGEDVRSLGKFVVKRIRELRKANLRQIVIVSHADQYWEPLLEELRKTDLPLHILLERGEKLPVDRPLVVLTRPLYAGGQEFDAAILVGLEQGVVPPRVVDNDALASAVEQQALREMYLAITRARYRVLVLLAPGASPTSVMQEAERTGLISRRVAQSV